MFFMKFLICAVYISLSLSLHSFCQAQEGCKITKYISPDGSLYFVVPHDTIYYTKESRLKAGLITDKENYFLSLVPFPRPGSIGHRKEYADLNVTLANKAELKMKFFDVRFTKDSTYTISYLIDKKLLDTLTHNEIESIYLKSPFKDKQYRLILHRDLIREHLACLQKLKDVQ